MRRTWASTSTSLHSHLETRSLWAQDKIDEGIVVVKKIGGDRNVADILTKYFSRPRLRRSLLTELPVAELEGRALIGATTAGKIVTLNS